MKSSPSKSVKTGAGKKRTRCDGKGAAPEPSLPFTPCPNPAKEWKKAELKTEDLLALVNCGFLREKEMDLWRTAMGGPYPMEKNPDEIPMFTRFVEPGPVLPASEFFKGMLRYYDIEYLNLNPNRVFHISVFVPFCEAFNLWVSSPTGFCFGSSSG
jgi:hypothetical protein